MCFQDGESPIGHGLREIELVQRVLAKEGGADRAGRLKRGIALSAHGGKLRQEPSHLGTQLGTLVHRHGGRDTQGRRNGASGTPVGGAHATAAGTVARRIGGGAHEVTPTGNGQHPASHTSRSRVSSAPAAAA